MGATNGTDRPQPELTTRRATCRVGGVRGRRVTRSAVSSRHQRQGREGLYQEADERATQSANVRAAMEREDY